MSPDDVRLGTSGKIARPCACRGWIVAEETPVPRNGEAVAKHQREFHDSWDLEAWVDENTAKVDVPIAVVKRVA
jgi:hypothetical protein